MAQKGITSRIVTLFNDMWKLIINPWKIKIKIKNHYVLGIGT